jgi:hypothetical protein
MTASSRALESVTALASELPGVTLADVLSEAALQTRVDRKYLLTPEQFQEFGRQIAGTFTVLDIDRRRVFHYESVYFDTPALDLYRAHRQGRRRRFKARVRTYLDSGDCMFEVKLKGRRGETVKHRLPYHLDYRAQLSTEAVEFLAKALHEEYGEAVPHLQPAVTTAYSRVTLVDLANGARLTCDVDLLCSRGEGQARGSDMVLVESKSAGPGGVADTVLRHMGIRPLSISKYCIAVALLHRRVAANRWNRTLRTHFGWAREVIPV